MIMIVAFVFVPADLSSCDMAYAGDGIEISVHGIKSDGTVDPGSTVYVEKDELESALHGFYDEYIHNRAQAGWSVDGKFVKTDLDSGRFSYVIKASDAGKTIRFETVTLNDDTYYNRMTEEYKINSLKANIIQGPSISGVQYSYGFLKKSIVVKINGYGIYNTNADSSYHYVYDKKIKLYCNGKYIGARTTSSYDVTFNNVPVKYNAKNIIKAEIYMTIEGKEVSGSSGSYIVPGGKLGRNTVYATKLSAGKAMIRWSGVYGATAYRIYKGKKLVKKTGAGMRKCVLKKKGAGKGKYIKKIQLKGNKYVISGWAVNRAKYTPLKKFKKIRISIHCDGKTVLSKTIRNKRINLKPRRGRKLSFILKGRSGADLCHGIVSYSVSVKCDPDVLTPRE